MPRRPSPGSRLFPAGGTTPGCVDSVQASMRSIPRSHNWLRIAFDGATHILVSPESGDFRDPSPLGSDPREAFSTSFGTRPLVEPAARAADGDGLHPLPDAAAAGAGDSLCWRSGRDAAGAFDQARGLDHALGASDCAAPAPHLPLAHALAAGGASGRRPAAG